MTTPPPSSRDPVRTYHVMTKPIGPICNLDCTYCFYLEKEQLFAHDEKFRMSDEVLEEFVKQYIGSQDAAEVNFAWQGGEPTLLGVDFFRRVVALQNKYAAGRRISNAIQTNGTLLNDEWCEFLTTHRFLVGLSVDGPRELHDRYRVDKRGKPTFDAVMKGLSFLQKHRTEFNTLTVVNRENSKHPLKVYRFLKEIGSGFLQFIPLVERNATPEAGGLGLDLALPPVPGEKKDAPVTAWSVQPKAYGKFLVEIFDEWVRRDVGRVFVQIFDVALGNWMGADGGICVFSETCGNAMALEHDGDLYACDHYVYPRYKLGNILNTSIREMLLSPEQRKFGEDKLTTLPRFCRECDVRFACHGECPKHRFVKTPDGEPGLNYLCPAYKRFFNHIDPYMKTMARLVQSRRPATLIMSQLAEQDQATQPAPAERNKPCPCGSGKKYKKCCGASS